MSDVFDEPLWTLELAGHRQNLIAELSGHYTRRLLHDQQMVEEAEITGRPVWIYLQPHVEARRMELELSLAAMDAFGVPG